MNWAFPYTWFGNGQRIILSRTEVWQAFGYLQTDVYNAACEIDFSTLSGLAPQRELPEGWRAPASAHCRVKTVEAALWQGGTFDDCRETLGKLFECLELDYDLCEVTQSLHLYTAGGQLCFHDL